jgi:hypothetical protein
MLKIAIAAIALLSVLSLSGTAFAQSAPTAAGKKPSAQVKPKAPMGCKQLGTVQGTFGRSTAWLLSRLALLLIHLRNRPVRRQVCDEGAI